MSPWSTGFWNRYWTTLRPYLFGVSGISGLAGIALVPDADPLRVLSATAAFTVSYGFGQALTDVFQTDTDALSAPYRPLIRGEISGAAVFLVSLAGLALCTTVFVVLNPWTAPVAALAVLGLASYTPAKRVYWLGPAWNAWIVACLPLIGALTASGSRLESVIRFDGMFPLLANVFLSYAIFVILGYFKDVTADRRTGYETLPVRWGRHITLRISVMLLVATSVSSLILMRAAADRFAVPGWPGAVLLGLAATLWIGGLSMLTAAHLRMRTATEDAKAFPAIELCVRGFVLLHAGQLTMLRPALLPPALILALITDVALRRRPMREQV